MSLAWGVGLLAVSIGASNAQSFNSYASNHVILVDGYTFTINGNPVTTANFGTSGTYEFGFSTGAPIHIQIVSTNVNSWNPGDVIAISALNEFGLIAPASSNLNFTASGDTIFNYNATTNTAWTYDALNSGTSSGGVYTAGPFGSNTDNLLGGVEHTAATDARFGDFIFSNVSFAGPIYLGAHFRQNGTVTTAPLIIDGFGGGTTGIVPEGSSLAMLGCGALPILGVLIRRRRNAKA